LVSGAASRVPKNALPTPAANRALAAAGDRAASLDASVARIPSNQAAVRSTAALAPQGMNNRASARSTSRAATSGKTPFDDGKTEFGVTLADKWGSVNTNWFSTKAEAEKFADWYRHGVYSTEDGSIVRIGMPTRPKESLGSGADGAGSALGSLSRRYEVGANGDAGTISTGKGDYGGVSYGLYQLSSKTGTAQRFVDWDSNYKNEFKGLKPGTEAFNDKWRQIAQDQPDTFGARQHEFIKETHYDPAVNRLRRDTGIDVNAASSALQNVVWSTAVQNGPTGGARVVERALDNLARQKPLASATDEDIIRAVYAERGKTDADGNLEYFSNSSHSMQQSVKRRYQHELQDALNMLPQQQGSRQAPVDPSDMLLP
jgi:hypothetical protein